MNVRDFSLLVKKEYKRLNGARFFSERALLSAILEHFGFHRNAPLITPEQPIGEKETDMAEDLRKLLAGYPIQYYLGTEWFCGYEFAVAPEVLIPRPETQALAEKAAAVAEEKSTVFDFCCGSGCIGLSVLLKREDLFCRMYDLPDAALHLSRENCERLGLTKRCSIEKMDVLSDDAYEQVRKYKPSLIVSNPPYLTPEEMEKIDDNVKNEPAMALLGGADGLAFYRSLIHLSAKTGVDLLCEIGCNQKEGIEKLLKLQDLEYEFYQDDAGLDRIFYTQKIK